MKKISHNENFLAEIEIKSGFSKFYTICNRVGSILKDSMFNFAFTYTRTQEKAIIGNSMYFTPDIESEVIVYAISLMLDIPLVNLLKRSGWTQLRSKQQNHTYKIVDSIQ